MKPNFNGFCCQRFNDLIPQLGNTSNAKLIYPSFGLNFEVSDEIRYHNFGKNAHK